MDIDSQTYNMNPDLLEAAITKKTKAIVPASLYGQCADFEKINQIAMGHGVPVIEDAAQSFGATHHGKKSCSLTTIAATSFFPSKPLGCFGDGGAIFTNDDDLGKAMRKILVHGQSARYVHTRLGVNGRMDTLQAAVLIEKMKFFDEEIELRQQVAKRYSEALGDHFRTPFVEKFNRSVFAQYTIEVDDREQVARKLKEAGIPTAIHYPRGLHQQTALGGLELREGSFPVTERAARRVLSLPMHPFLSESDQSRVIAALREQAP